MKSQKNNVPVPVTKTQTRGARRAGNAVDGSVRNATRRRFGRFGRQMEHLPSPLCAPIHLGTVCHVCEEPLLRGRCDGETMATKSAWTGLGSARPGTLSFPRVCLGR